MKITEGAEEQARKGYSLILSSAGRNFMLEVIAPFIPLGHQNGSYFLWTGMTLCLICVPVVLLMWGSQL